MLSRRATIGGLVFAAAIMTIASVAEARLADYYKPVRDLRGNVVRSTNGNCVLTRQEGFGPECGGLRKHVEIALEDRTVYFAFNDSSLTDEAKSKLDSLAGILRNEQDVKSLSIVGYADRIGSVSYNQALSRKRALTVRDYLVAQGMTNVNVAKTRWVGKSKPSTNCAGDKKTNDLIACLAPDRKVEVEVNYAKTVVTTPAGKPVHHKAKAAVKKAAPAPAAK